MRDLMTTREVAEYLRLKERKIYDLVSNQDIPFTRVTGKLLFPRAMIDVWLREHSEASGHAASAAAPAVVGGSHDPLLSWAITESGSGLATLFDGSMDGVKRMIGHEVCASGVHVIHAGDETYNTHVIPDDLVDDVALIEWAWREQGLIVAADNSLGINALADVVLTGARFADRQPSAGSHVLLRHLLAAEGFPADAVTSMSHPARNESDVALAVADGTADAALGIRAVADEYRLGFIPLRRERYDLLVFRHDYFEAPLQTLLRFARSDAFAAKASALGGYDISGLGNVMVAGR